MTRSRCRGPGLAGSGANRCTGHRMCLAVRLRGVGSTVLDAPSGSSLEVLRLVHVPCWVA
eukprot:5571486-Prymnesium_polylepis.1